MINDSFPYVLFPKKTKGFFDTLQKAAIPDKFTNNVLSTIFMLKGSNDRPFITLLKSLNFIDEKGAPLQNYYDYKDASKSSLVLGKCVRECYDELFKMDDNIHKLEESKIKNKLMSLTGKSSDNQVLNLRVKTFVQLIEIAKIETPPHEVEVLENNNLHSLDNLDNENHSPPSPPKEFVLTHTIVVNIPTTTDKKVYDVLFKSIKENLL